MPVSRRGEPLCEPPHQMAQVAISELFALAGGAVRLRQLVGLCEVRCAALLRRGRTELVEERVEAVAGGDGRSRLEVRQRAVDAVPQRLPAVLLDAPGGCRGGGGL